MLRPKSKENFITKILLPFLRHSPVAGNNTMNTRLSLGYTGHSSSLLWQAAWKNANLHPSTHLDEARYVQQIMIIGTCPFHGEIGPSIQQLSSLSIYRGSKCANACVHEVIQCGGETKAYPVPCGGLCAPLSQDHETDSKKSQCSARNDSSQDCYPMLILFNAFFRPRSRHLFEVNERMIWGLTKIDVPYTYK